MTTTSRPDSGRPTTRAAVAARLPAVVVRLRMAAFARVNGPRSVTVPGPSAGPADFVALYRHPAADGQSRGSALSDLLWYWLAPGVHVHQEHIEPGPLHEQLARCTRTVLARRPEEVAELARECLRAAPPPPGGRVLLRDAVMPACADLMHRLVFSAPADRATRSSGTAPTCWTR
ncbi:hypothetical protein ACFV6F_32100 [Kitasatospora phosalacinea]|uniref:hypothetical protein n=1 Tax=Kitasatospora phosalacinea TaxID=2065 RepID=UPI00366526E1